jgi:hypothetical protein
MAQSATTPNFNDTTKQDHAQFEDCTPCRVVGNMFKAGIAMLVSDI